MITSEQVELILGERYGEHFWVSLKNAELNTGNPESYYSASVAEQVTFDIGNGKVHANVDLTGSILDLSSFGETYAFGQGNPGIWLGNSVYQARDISFALTVNGSKHLLWRRIHGFKLSLLHNIVPVGEHYIDEGLEIKLVTFAPISADGLQRPRAMIIGLFLKNTGSRTMAGTVYPRGLDGQINVVAADGLAREDEMPYSLGPGETYWLPIIASPYPAVDDIAEVKTKSSAQWLRETLDYYDGLTGELKTPGDPFLAEFFERQVHQCLGCAVMNIDGRIVGTTSWGTYPVGAGISQLDFRYSSFPLMALAPEIGARVMEWWYRWGSRHPDNYCGGVQHSASNSLSSIAMACFYYTSTGDASFFTKRPWLKEKSIELLDELLGLFEDGSARFHTNNVSDGPTTGDFHTGSHILAWYCLSGYARLLEEVFEDKTNAQRFRDAARRMKTEVDTRNVVDGPFGKQYAEMIQKDGMLPELTFEWRAVVDPPKRVLIQDGEESDTTMAPIFGYTSLDNPLLHNLKKMALTSHNGIYSEALDGILWIENVSVPTFPGYMSSLAASDDADSFRKNIDRIRSFTEIDGSIYWWPYYPCFDQVRRFYTVMGVINRPGWKCGWASGVFVSLFISQYLGVNYDAPARELTFRPFLPTSSFTWKNLRFGDDRFDASFQESESWVRLGITNLNKDAVTVSLQAICPEGADAGKVRLNGKPFDGPMTRSTFFGRTVLALDTTLEHGMSSVLEVGEEES